MASVTRDPRGRKRVLFVDQDGRRRTVRLGKCSAKQALAFKVRLEALIAGRFSSIDDETSRWVADLPDDMHAKLAAVGLVEPRAAQSLTLGELVERYVESRTDVKPGTVLLFRQAQRSLMDYFGPDKLLREITEGDAELWRLYLVQQGLAEATIRKRCKLAKQFLRRAVRQRIIQSNPFAGLQSASVGNDKRLYFVSQGETAKVLEACPDTQWRLIFALCRYGGLRCPSEVLGLQWQDVNWEQSRMLVHSPKTAHHAGGESRLVPIFAELRPYLMQAFEEAEPGSQYVVTRYRESSANLRTQAHRITRRAGLKPWPRTFQNLRATRETELAETFPLHVVTTWFGNTQPVAMKHYLSVTSEHFARAAQNPAHEAHFPAQYPAVPGGNERKPNLMEAPENADLPVGAGACTPMPQFLLAPRGFEPLLPG